MEAPKDDSNCPSLHTASTAGADIPLAVLLTPNNCLYLFVFSASDLSKVRGSAMTAECGTRKSMQHFL